MLVCVEAGLGLEAAFARVGMEMTTSHPRLAEQFGAVVLELRAGRSHEDALRRMADRAGADEIRAFATLLIQSTKLGSSIAQTLRIYASEMRERRRMRAEEKAHRLPVLLSIPLVACMLPVMIGVLMLPAAIRVVRAVLPALDTEADMNGGAKFCALAASLAAAGCAVGARGGRSSRDCQPGGQAVASGRTAWPMPELSSRWATPAWRWRGSARCSATARQCRKPMPASPDATRRWADTISPARITRRRWPWRPRIPACSRDLRSRLPRRGSGAVLGHARDRRPARRLNRHHHASRSPAADGQPGRRRRFACQGRASRCSGGCRSEHHRRVAAGATGSVRRRGRDPGPRPSDCSHRRTARGNCRAAISRPARAGRRCARRRGVGFRRPGAQILASAGPSITVELPPARPASPAAESRARPP